MNFLQWIRTKPCAIIDKGACHGDVVAHHVREKNAGVALKPSDKGNLVPMCHKHHMELHNTGKLTFQTKYKISLKILALDLYEEFKNDNH